MKLVNQHLLLAYKNIEQFIKYEIRHDGLLEDVEMFLTNSIMNEHIETPLVWMEKGTITPSDHLGDFGVKECLDVPVSFVCCGMEEDEYSASEQGAYNLALRVVASILRNYEFVRPYDDYSLSFRDVRLERIEPSGTLEIVNKRVIIPACRVDMIFVVDVDWMVAEELDTTSGTSVFVQDLDEYRPPLDAVLEEENITEEEGEDDG